MLQGERPGAVEREPRRLRRDFRMSEIRFDGRVAIITGAGGGLGKTYALELARRGASVVVNDLGGALDGSGGGASMAEATAGEIAEAGGVAVANFDSVATPEGGRAIVQTALDNFGKVDVLINNAGSLRDKSFLKLEPAQLEAVLDVHLKGAFFVTQPAFASMKAQGYGRIVMTTSASGVFGNFGQSNYGAAKMGLVGLMNVLAVEGEKYGIAVNAIAPVARTRMTEGLLGSAADKLAPEFVTPLVVYLCSEQCQQTHEIFDVGGGRYARIFIGLGRGWVAPGGAAPQAEEVLANIDAIRDREGYSLPLSTPDEIQAILEAIQNQ
jgi:NAD(P)-dependent dehydrogenase (short-subunit alcohol dehydrogenase family)